MKIIELVSLRAAQVVLCCCRLQKRVFCVSEVSIRNTRKSQEVRFIARPYFFPVPDTWRCRSLDYRSASRIPRNFDLVSCHINMFFCRTRHSNNSGQNLWGILEPGGNYPHTPHGGIRFSAGTTPLQELQFLWDISIHPPSRKFFIPLNNIQVLILIWFKDGHIQNCTCHLNQTNNVQRDNWKSHFRVLVVEILPFSSFLIWTIFAIVWKDLIWRGGSGNFPVVLPWWKSEIFSPFPHHMK